MGSVRLRHDSVKPEIRIAPVLLGACWLFAAPVFGDTLQGEVRQVASGDTFTIETADGGFYKIRLRDVDAPELSQTFGKQARAFTESRVGGKTVTVHVSLVDRFQRRIGTVSLPDGTLLNEELVRLGYAWHYPALQPVSGVLSGLEREARQNRLGLWVDDAAVPPWIYRRESAYPAPPQEPKHMDYDRYFEYGLIGNPDTRIYLWPACGGYPDHRDGWVRFGSLATAEGRGYKRAANCPRPDGDLS